MKDNKRIYSAALLYALIIGLSFLFVKIALESANPLDLLAHRFSASFIVVVGILIFKKEKLHLNLKKVRKILPLAIFYPVAYFGFQTFGLKYATSSEAGILLGASPVFTLILASIFLKEKSTFLQKISVMISVIGVVYITVMKNPTLEISSMKGIILLLISSLTFAGYSVMARILTKDFSNTELSYVMVAIGFICFNLIALGNNLFLGTMSSFLTPLKSGSFILSILYLGVLSSLLTSLLSNYVLSKIEASKMSVFSNLGTVISIIAGVTFLNEKIFSYHIIGSILIVIGVLGTNFLDTKFLEKKKDGL